MDGKLLLEHNFRVAKDMEAFGGLAGVWRALSKWKQEEIAIQEFTLTRSSLEHVFREFAKVQEN